MPFVAIASPIVEKVYLFDAPDKDFGWRCRSAPLQNYPTFRYSHDNGHNGLPISIYISEDLGKTMLALHMLFIKREIENKMSLRTVRRI